MGYFDYSREPRSDIAFVDMKSFYASVECGVRGPWLASFENFALRYEPS